MTSTLEPWQLNVSSYLSSLSKPSLPLVLTTPVSLVSTQDCPDPLTIWIRMRESDLFPVPAFGRTLSKVEVFELPFITTTASPKLSTGFRDTRSWYPCHVDGY
jgi:hypothetical protein